jgi:hypothetical protein
MRHTKGPHGSLIDQDRFVTGFNTEEATVGLTEMVPFPVKNGLKNNDGKYSKANDWQPFAVVDGNLITGKFRVLHSGDKSHIETTKR